MRNEQVLYILEQSRGQLVTGGEIAKRLDVSRTAVWKTVAALREEGHEIESVPNRGYRLAAASDGLSGQAIREHLTTRMLGRSMELLKTVDSTNLYLRSLNTSALPEGHAVVADGQTGGRGRLNRTFYSPPRNGIYLSCLLKPPIPLIETPFLTICAAVAVSRAVESVCGMRVGIKWVNDIFHDGKKLCGILTEASVTAEMRCVDYAVVGIGLNTGDIAPEAEDVATSVYRATGLRGVRNRLIAEILNRLEEIYLDYTVRGEKREILAAYEGKLFILGKRVEVRTGGAVYEATVLGVDDSGGLVVKDMSGDVRHVTSGEIRLVKEI